MVNKIKFWTGAYIDNIVFCFGDGNEKHFRTPDNCGAQQPHFDLDKGEYIVKVDAWQGDYLRRIVLTTNTGRKFDQGTPEDSKGSLQSWTAPAKQMVVGLDRPNYGLCPNLRGIFTLPLDKAPVNGKMNTFYDPKYDRNFRAQDHSATEDMLGHWKYKSPGSKPVTKPFSPAKAVSPPKNKKLDNIAHVLK